MATNLLGIPRMKDHAHEALMAELGMYSFQNIQEITALTSFWKLDKLALHEIRDKTPPHQRTLRTLFHLDGIRAYQRNTPGWKRRFIGSMHPILNKYNLLQWIKKAMTSQTAQGGFTTIGVAKRRITKLIHNDMKTRFDEPNGDPHIANSIMGLHWQAQLVTKKPNRK